MHIKTIYSLKWINTVISLKCKISGKEAINKPTAGTGTPLKETC